MLPSILLQCYWDGTVRFRKTIFPNLHIVSIPSDLSTLFKRRVNYNCRNIKLFMVHGYRLYMCAVWYIKCILNTYICPSTFPWTYASCWKQFCVLFINLIFLLWFWWESSYAIIALYSVLSAENKYKSDIFSTTDKTDWVFTKYF